MTTTMTRPARGPALRFPLQPVMDLTRSESYEQLAVRLQTTGDAVRQWAARGLSSQQADSVATTLGFHPLNIWDNFNDDLFEDFDDGDDWEHQSEAVPAPVSRTGRRRYSRSARRATPSVSATFSGARRKFLGRN
jgi:hypothetical protein